MRVEVVCRWYCIVVPGLTRDMKWCPRVLGFVRENWDGYEEGKIEGGGGYHKP